MTPLPSRQVGPLTLVGVATVLLAVAAYIAGWQLGWIELMVVAGGCAAALSLAVPFVVGRVALEVERQVDPQRVMVGDTATAVLRVVNPARRRTRAVTIDERIDGAVLPVHVPALGPRRDHVALYALPTGRRAKLRIGPTEIARSDPLGLLRRHVSQAPATTLWVHPRWTAVQPLPSGFAKDLEGPTSDTSPAGDVAFHALRPYQLGDDRRHIHWMSTARTGTLMVRHYVDNRRPSLGILLDDEASVHDDAQFELSVEVVTSLLMSVLRHQLPAAARTGSEWVLGRFRPGSHESVLEILTEVERRSGTPSLLESAADLTRVEPATSAVAIVTGSRTAPELLAPVAYLRRRARVIVVLVERAGEPADGFTALPGARVLRASTLEEFRTAWNRMAT